MPKKAISAAEVKKLFHAKEEQRFQSWLERGDVRQRAEAAKAERILQARQAEASRALGAKKILQARQAEAATALGAKKGLLAKQAEATAAAAEAKRISEGKKAIETGHKLEEARRKAVDFTTPAQAARKAGWKAALKARGVAAASKFPRLVGAASLVSKKWPWIAGGTMAYGAYQALKGDPQEPPPTAPGPDMGPRSAEIPETPFTIPPYQMSPEMVAAYKAISDNLARTSGGLTPTAGTPREQEAQAAPAPRPLNFWKNLVAGAGKALGAMSFGAGPGGPTLSYRPELAGQQAAMEAETEAKKKQLALEEQRNIEAVSARQDETAQRKAMIEGQNLERQGNLLSQMETANWHRYQAAITEAKIKYTQEMQNKVLKMNQEKMRLQWGEREKVEEVAPTGFWGKFVSGTKRKTTYTRPSQTPGRSTSDTDAVINTILSGMEMP